MLLGAPIISCEAVAAQGKVWAGANRAIAPREDRRLKWFGGRA